MSAHSRYFVLACCSLRAQRSALDPCSHCSHVLRFRWRRQITLLHSSVC